MNVSIDLNRTYGRGYLRDSDKVIIEINSWDEVKKLLIGIDWAYRHRTITTYTSNDGSLITIYRNKENVVVEKFGQQNKLTLDDKGYKRLREQLVHALKPKKLLKT